VTPCPCPQVRRAIQQMLFQGKDFSWIRHVTIAVVLLTFINLLVIFAPSILGIFGMIGAWQHPAPVPPRALGVALPDPPVPQFPLLTVPGPGTVWGVPSPVPVPAGWVPRCGAGCLLFPWAFPLIPHAGLPPLGARLGAKALAAAGGGVMGTVPAHGVLRFLEGFVRAGGGAGGGTGPGLAAGLAGLSRGRGLPPTLSLSAPGATSAPCLIFIFPAIFYIRIMPKDKEPLRSTPKILVSMGRGGHGGDRDGGPSAALETLSP